MARKATDYIVIHCSATRPSQDIDAKEIDRWHRSRGWLKIGYHKVLKRDGTENKYQHELIPKLTLNQIVHHMHM